MLKINGIFSTGNLKATTNGKKYLNLSNVDKDQYGNKTYTNYTLWINDKVSDLFTNEIKRKLKNGNALIVIDGYLKVQKNDNYTNLTIIPTNIKEFSKN